MSFSLIPCCLAILGGIKKICSYYFLFFSIDFCWFGFKLWQRSWYKVMFAVFLIAHWPLLACLCSSGQNHKMLPPNKKLMLTLLNIYFDMTIFWIESTRVTSPEAVSFEASCIPNQTIPQTPVKSRLQPKVLMSGFFKTSRPKFLLSKTTWFTYEIVVVVCFW